MYYFLIMESNKYNMSEKVINSKKNSSQIFKEIKSIEIPYRELYIKLFGTSSGSSIKSEYKNKEFRLVNNDSVKDVGKLISANFRNYSMVTMFQFTFENSDDKTVIDTEQEQPTILMLD